MEEFSYQNLICMNCGKLSLTTRSKDKHLKVCKGKDCRWIHVYRFEDQSSTGNPIQRFLASLESKRTSWSLGSVKFSVDRENLFEQSFEVLLALPAADWFKEFNVEFIGEVGDDAGGLTKEWIDLMFLNSFEKGLFVRTATEEEFYTIPILLDDTSFKKYFIFGKLLGKLLLEKLSSKCRFHEVIWKQLLGQNVELEEFKSFNPVVYNSLKSLENEDISEFGIFGFSYQGESDQVIELVPGGRNVEITNENKFEFIKMNFSFGMIEGIKEPLRCIKEGLFSVVSKKLFEQLRVDEVSKLVNGHETVNLDDLQNFTEYHDEFNESHLTIILFWKVIKSFDNNKVKKFIKFVTGSSCAPLQGFKELKTLRGERCRFNVKPIPSNRYPQGHTCFNRLDLPICSQEREMKIKLDFITSRDFAFDIS